MDDGTDILTRQFVVFKQKPHGWLAIASYDDVRIAWQCVYDKWLDCQNEEFEIRDQFDNDRVVYSFGKDDWAGVGYQPAVVHPLP